MASGMPYARKQSANQKQADPLLSHIPREGQIMSMSLDEKLNMLINGPPWLPDYLGEAIAKRLTGEQCKRLSEASAAWKDDECMAMLERIYDKGQQQGWLYVCGLLNKQGSL